MSATTQNNLSLLDSGRNRQWLATSNSDGVHTLHVTAVPATAGGGGGGGGTAAPTISLTSEELNADSQVVAAGAVAVYVELVSGSVLVDGQPITSALSISAPDGFLLPAVSIDASTGSAVVRELRPS